MDRNNDIRPSNEQAIMDPSTDVRPSNEPPNLHSENEDEGKSSIDMNKETGVIKDDKSEELLGNKEDKEAYQTTKNVNITFDEEKDSLHKESVGRMEESSSTLCSKDVSEVDNIQANVVTSESSTNAMTFSCNDGQSENFSRTVTESTPQEEDAEVTSVESNITNTDQTNSALLDEEPTECTEPQKHIRQESDGMKIQVPEGANTDGKCDSTSNEKEVDNTGISFK